jgi:iron complex transport system substrate-binding protein
MKPKLKAILLGVVLAAMAAASGSAQPGSQRLVSLVPALTEMLFAIGAGPEVVAVSSFDTDPPEVSELPRVGALLDPDVERILSLRPTLVMIYGSQTDLQEQLRRADIDTFSYRHGGLAHVTNTIRALGLQTGHTAEAERAAADIARRLAEVRARTAERPKVRTMLVFGREHNGLRQIYVSGGRGFLHDLLDVAGGANVFADITLESVQVSTEMILARAPDAIVELRAEPIATAEETLAAVRSWAPLASVPAVRSGRVYILAGRELVVPGPRVADAADRMARVIHPEAFK